MAAKASLCAMVVEGWLARAAARAARIARRCETPSGSCSYAELLAAARAGRAASWPPRRAARARASAIALPPGLAFAQALHACLLLGRRRGAGRPAPRGAERERILERRLRASAVDRAARSRCRRRRGGASGPARARRRHDLDAVAARDPHLRHHRRAASRSS